ncbi:hypothetical protein [Faecalibacterium prausnitzii]|uniref:hypothetical protein n=1 Tax=Faecalibacterium prausnitzii TaxID=853 RepID=UPI001A9B3499|nr:hypothetical protein [Faecalibacterium prausnitzii]
MPTLRRHFLKKIPPTTYNTSHGEMDGDFQIFHFLFVPHTTKKSNFANSLFLFRWIIQRIFQNAEQFGEISCPARIGNAENEISATVWAQKKQETVL